MSEEHAGEVVTLKDIEAARRAHRRSLRAAINEQIARVADFLSARTQSGHCADRSEPPVAPARTKLRIYEEDGR